MNTTQTIYGMIAGESAPDEQTGTRRLDLWREPAIGGAYGDAALGDALTARYANGDLRVEIAVYPIDGRVAFGWDDEQAGDYPYDVEGRVLNESAHKLRGGK